MGKPKILCKTSIDRFTLHFCRGWVLTLSWFQSVFPKFRPRCSACSIAYFGSTRALRQSSAASVSSWCALSGPVVRDAATLSQRYHPIARCGAFGVSFLVSQHGQWGAIPPPPCLSVSLLASMRSGGAIPPPHTRGISRRCLHDTTWKQGKRVRDPLCDTISKGYCAIRRGISHWAAKGVHEVALAFGRKCRWEQRLRLHCCLHC